MKYKNADEVFPKELMKEIRRFMPEGYFYVSSCRKRRAWGSISGQKSELQKRNQQIFEEYQNGKTVNEIAKERYLSERTIYHILHQLHT